MLGQPEEDCRARYRVSPRRRRRVAVSIFLWLGFAVVSGGAPRRKGHEVDLRVYGEGWLTSQKLDLTVYFGPLFRQGARLYSEPSHTLLLLVMTPRFASSHEAADLKEEAARKKAVVRLGSVIGGDRFEVRYPPEGDNRIAVWAMTDTEEFLVADARVTVGRFDFRTTWSEWLGQVKHCCYCRIEVCVEVTEASPAFTCCWCPNTSASAGSVECASSP